MTSERLSRSMGFQARVSPLSDGHEVPSLWRQTPNGQRAGIAGGSSRADCGRALSDLGCGVSGTDVLRGADVADEPGGATGDDRIRTVGCAGRFAGIVVGASFAEFCCSRFIET